MGNRKGKSDIKLKTQKRDKLLVVNKYIELKALFIKILKKLLLKLKI
jgi:hypothetical protein